MVLTGGDAPIMENLDNGLLIAYIIDMGDRFQYVQHRHLETSGIIEGELHKHAMENLALLAKEKLVVHPRGSTFAVFLEGNVEASLILIDDLWEKNFARSVTTGFVAEMPARDVLAFCDLVSQEGIAELHQVVARVSAGGDHLLTSVLYRRQERKWIQFEG
jgi:uncharacterized protein YtpQ (UPF0354 family)